MHIEENFVKVLAIFFYCGTSTIICAHNNVGIFRVPLATNDSFAVWLCDAWCSVPYRTNFRRTKLSKSELFLKIISAENFCPLNNYYVEILSKILSYLCVMIDRLIVLFCCLMLTFRVFYNGQTKFCLKKYSLKFVGDEMILLYIWTYIQRIFLYQNILWVLMAICFDNIGHKT